jgi:uncharacterized membrane protein
VSERQPDTNGNGNGSSGNGSGVLQGVLSELPTDQLKQEFEDLLKALAQRAVAMATGQGGGAVGKAVSGAVGGGRSSAGRGLLGGGLSAVTGAVTKAVGGGGKGSGGSSGQKSKVTNIVEDIEVGLPRTVAYNLWTQFEDFPSFMKKVESVNQEAPEELTWSAQILWSHRTWRSTIVDQVPDERIIWRSEADRGHVDGAVTFHAITPDDTRVLVVLEYHPRGFFEGTGNLWRAQGRRVRLELKHFRRHAMTQALLHPDEITGWRGEIRDGEVVRGDKDGDRPEDDDRADEPGSEDEDDYADEDDDEEDDQDRDEYDREEEDDEDEDDRDEYDDYDEDDDGLDEEDEDEHGEEEPEDESAAPRRARSRAGSRGR